MYVGPSCNNSGIIKDLPTYLSHLSISQRQDMEHLLKAHPTIIQDKPSRCNLLTHDILIQEGTLPIKQAPCRQGPEKTHIM